MCVCGGGGDRGGGGGSVLVKYIWQEEQTRQFQSFTRSKVIKLDLENSRFCADRQTDKWTDYDDKHDQSLYPSYMLTW